MSFRDTLVSDALIFSRCHCAFLCISWMNSQTVPVLTSRMQACRLLFPSLCQFYCSAVVTFLVALIAAVGDCFLLNYAQQVVNVVFTKSVYC